MDLTRFDYGKLCRQVLFEHLTNIYGKLEHKGSWFFTIDNTNRILTLYSSLNNDRWWYGIIYKYWSNWDENSCLALIMRDGNYCSYVFMNSKESNELIKKLNPGSNNQKYINVRIPSTGKIYIQEWRDFQYQERIVKIGNIDPEKAKSDKFIKTLHSLSNDDKKKLLAALEELGLKK